MELKDFIKGVISEIVNAIDESQKALGDKACVSPIIGSGGSSTHIKAGKGYVPVSAIDFDVALTVSATETANSGVSGKISIFEIIKAGAEAGDTTQMVTQNVSRVKFQIPVAYPPGEPKFSVESTPERQRPKRREIPMVRNTNQ